MNSTSTRASKKNELICDECEKKVKSIKRNYKGKRYCSTCYARIFKRIPCPKCENLSRLPKNIPGAICRKCERNKPCIRCGKTAYKVGRITSYGPVCKPCSKYFNQSKICPECGAQAKVLTKVSRLGINKGICDRCARTDYATCQACRRYRLLQKASDGRMLCQKCLVYGEIPCPLCSKPMPAGMGKKCSFCYWAGLLEKRLKINMMAFSSPQLAHHFESFGKWLASRVGVHKAAISINRHFIFFGEIQKFCQDIPNYKTLIEHFGSQRLRKAHLPMQWLTETKLVSPDPVVKEEHSERKRIQNILNKCQDKSQEKEIILNYYRHLTGKLEMGGKLRSVRLALSSAFALLTKGSQVKKVPPDQVVLCSFLNDKPGQKASVTGFVNFLKNHYQAKLQIPQKVVSAKYRRKQRLESELIQLLKTNEEKESNPRKVIGVMLAYFHGLPKNVGRLVKKSDIIEDSEGFLVKWKGNNYWVPKYYRTAN